MRPKRFGKKQLEQKQIVIFLLRIGVRAEIDPVLIQIFIRTKMGGQVNNAFG